MTVKIISIFALLVVFLGIPAETHAYSTNMPASLVLGQADFTSSSANRGGTAAANSLSNPLNMVVAQGRLFMVDQSNHRVLVWNQVPTTNGQAADLVLGQADFTSSSANRGGTAAANSFNNPVNVYSDGIKLFVADQTNNRVLIWNTLPTQNGQAADVVVGQPDFITASAGTTASKFSAPFGVFVTNGKLFISERGNRRVVIFNTIPTVNSMAADVVMGQDNFTTGAYGGVAANRFGTAAATSGPRSLTVYNNKLFVLDTENSRALIFNSVPTTNGVAADVVLGQPNFTNSTSDNGGTSCATLTNTSTGIAVTDNGRLVIANSARVLIWNQVPSTNFQSADLILGQPDCSSRVANNGGIGANTLATSVRAAVEIGTNLFVADSGNNRVLIFNNTINHPGISLNGNPENIGGGLVRLRGQASVAAPYTMASVQFSVNGGSFEQASPETSWGDASEEFHFDFDPTLNQSRDENGELIGGYTVQVKGINNNADVTDHLFYFSPLTVHGPLSPSLSISSTPTFDFSVNKNRITMKDNLQKYQIQVKQGTGSWTTLIDEIPIDFQTVKGSDQNLQKSVYEGLATNNGVFENQNFVATYTDNSSRIKVYSKTNFMSGPYQWKVVAVDNTGHGQESSPRTLLVLGSGGLVMDDPFPLAVLSVTGIGNPHLSSSSRAGAKASYSTTSHTPTFFGIAWSGAAVTLELTKQNCTSNCTQTFQTTAQDSRFSITPTILAPGKYSTNILVNLGDQFNQLPTFTLQIR